MSEVTINSPNGNNKLSVQCEEDGTIKLDSITSTPEFSNCVSLKYQLGDSNETTEIKSFSGVFESPPGGWAQDGIIITAVLGLIFYKINI